MYIVECLSTLIWFRIISQVYVDLVEDRSRANSYFVSLKDLAGNIQCFQCQELVYYFHKTEPKGDGAILIFLPGDILRGATGTSYVCSRTSYVSALSVRLGWHHQDLHPLIPVRLHDAPVEVMASKEQRWSMNEVSVWVTVLWTRGELVNFLLISADVAGENYKLITLHSLMTPEQQHEAFERPPKGTRKAGGENDLTIFHSFLIQNSTHIYFNPSRRCEQNSAGGALHQHRRGICDHRRRGLRHRHRCTQGTQLWCRRFHELPRLNHVVEVNHIVSMKLLWFPMVSKCSVVTLGI